MASVDDLVSELNDHGFEDTASTRKVGIINDTIADICSREPWPFLEKELTLTFDGANALPSNFPVDFSKAIGLHDPSSGASISWERWEVIRKRFANALGSLGQGAPINYYFVGGKLKVYPIPSASQTIDLDYLAFHPTVNAASLETDILIPARHSRVIVLGSLYKLYSMEDDPELSAVFSSEYEHRISIMREDLIRVQYDTPDRIFVQDADDYDTYPYWP
jgi:hypothetical protein